MNFSHEISTEVGELTVVTSRTALQAILWEDDDRHGVRLPGDISQGDRPPIIDEVERQLREYFAGNRSAFDFTVRA